MHSSTESDLEIAAATAQALAYINGYFSIRQTIKQQGYMSTTQKLDEARYEQNKLILKKWCVLNNRDACNSLSSIQSIESSMIVAADITDLIG